MSRVHLIMQQRDGVLFIYLFDCLFVASVMCAASF